MSLPEQITQTGLADLVSRFYGRVREDALLGPVFNRAVEDWPAHLDSLTHFWSSVMLGSGTFKGSPMAAHLRHAADITPEMFERWLSLWRQTTAECFAPAAAAQLQDTATRIGRSLQATMRVW